MFQQKINYKRIKYMKNNTYGIDIQKAHENLYFKKFKVNLV